MMRQRKLMKDQGWEHYAFLMNALEFDNAIEWCKQNHLNFAWLSQQFWFKSQEDWALFTLRWTEQSG